MRKSIHQLQAARQPTIKTRSIDMDTSVSEVFSGDVLADKDPAQASEPSTPAEQTLGSQPATGRQPQVAAGQTQRAPVLPFSQIRPGLD